MYSGPIGAPGKKGAVKDPVMTPGQIQKVDGRGREAAFVVLRWTEFRAGDEVCLHPCRIHRRVFEQTDSRRTPLSAINQQQRLSRALFLRVCFCARARSGNWEQKRSALMIVRKGRHDLLFAKSESAVEQILQRRCIYVFLSLLFASLGKICKNGKSTFSVIVVLSARHH